MDGARTLLLLGEPGTGKTELLTFAAEHARSRGRLVLAAQGSEAESRQSFAALHQLLLPLLGNTDALPGHLARALETAFGLVQGPPEPMLLRVAVLTLLTDTARGRPLLLSADDVQHFDRDSLDVLGFVTRRTQGIPALLAARGQTPPDGVPAGLPALLLGPLSERAAAELLDAQPHAPTGRARSELLRQAHGNPLALIELCRAAAAGRLPGGGLPQPERIQRLYAARLRDLPAATRRLLLHAAASQYEDLGTIMRAAGAGDDLSAWAAAEQAGLVHITDGRVHFRHPLARAGCYHAASAHQRQQAHRALADALTADPSRRAWHLAAACVGHDEKVAAALEDTAGLAERRGGFHAAAQALQRAAECSPAPADRARRYAKALHAATNAADPSWARELYDKVTALTDDPDLLGMAACGAAMALSLSGHQRHGFDLLTQTPEPRSGATVFARASVLGAIAYQSGLPEHRAPIPDLLDAAVTQSDAAPFTELATHDARTAVHATTLAAADPTAAPALLQRIRRRADAPGTSAQVADMTWTLAIGGAAWYADESDLCVDTFRQAYARLSAYGALGPAAPTLTAMAAALIDTGRWTEADEHLEHTAELAAVHALRFVRTDVEALRTTLRALRGGGAGAGSPGAGSLDGGSPYAGGPYAGGLNGAGASDAARTPDAYVSPDGHLSSDGYVSLDWTAVGLDENRATHARLLRAAGACAAAAGDHDGAYRHFRRLFGPDGTPLHYFLSPRSIADLAAAAQRTGRGREAARVVAAIRTPRPTVRMALLLHHADALTGELDDAEHHFGLATGDPAAAQWPLARAQAALHYAQWLRRRRRPLDARPLLVGALETFTRLGAAGFAEEARVELRASGVATRPVRTTPLSQLTAQQREIVRLAARGLRNREIGERLRLSPRTVSSHLYQVYPKLGVSSRNQLRGLVDELQGEP